MTKKHLKTKDLVNIGVYTALYFVCVAIARFATVLILPGLATIFIPGVVGLIAGPIYMLLCQKVPKFGAITIMGTIMGLFFLISGHFAPSFVPYVFCGVLADVIQTRINKQDSDWLRGISYIVFNIGSTGPVLFLWVMKNAYIEALVSRGKNEEYIQRTFENITSGTFFIFAAATLIGGILGGILGIRIIKKHFSRKAKVV